MMQHLQTQTQTQTQTRTRTRTRTRRLSACNRHPSEPVTGFCPLCLRDRLAGLDSAPAPAPELSRSKSVATETRGVLIDLNLDPRRNSFDVRARSSLSDLFVVESKDLGVSSGDTDDAGDCEIRVSDDEVMEGDLKTMKEIIEIELESEDKRRNFTEKLRKWRLNRMEKKQSMCCINGGIENSWLKLGQGSQFRDTQSEVADFGFGRRSCDTEPRVSIDAHRVSVENPRFSLDEHRGNAFPRLTPMLSVVDNMQMHSNSNARVSPASDVIFQGTKLVITEKELKEWHLNSIKNKTTIESASNAPDSTSKASPIKMMDIKNTPTEQKKNVITSKWRKICNLWGYKQKLDGEHIPETRVVRNPSYVNSTTRRYSTSDINSGLLKLYLSPFRSSRRNKSVKSRAPSLVINGLKLH